jgi:hypothetical protein
MPGLFTGPQSVPLVTTFYLQLYLFSQPASFLVTSVLAVFALNNPLSQAVGFAESFQNQAQWVGIQMI